MIIHYITINEFGDVDAMSLTHLKYITCMSHASTQRANPREMILPILRYRLIKNYIFFVLPLLYD